MNRVSWRTHVASCTRFRWRCPPFRRSSPTKWSSSRMSSATTSCRRRHRSVPRLCDIARRRLTRRNITNESHHPFNGPFSGTTRMSRYRKGKTNLDFTKARDSEWQWHQLGHMQVCTALQTNYHASTPPLIFYRPDALPTTQPTASKH